MKFLSIIALISILQSSAFVASKQRPQRTVSSFFMANTIEEIESIEETDSKSFEDLAIIGEDDLELSTLDSLRIKKKLLNLLPRMTGSADEFRMVESYVNALEDRYTPVQTLDFLNIAMTGEWQLLFSTNLAGGPKPKFRLREMYQSIEAKNNSMEGTVANQVSWELAEDGINFDASGTFTILCNYEINQGARLLLTRDDSVVRLSKGSALPKDIENLVGLLNRAMPKELFDPDDHAMDTTYLDGDLRIVRMTGPKFEGVRDIFIRRNSMVINPLKEQ
jgi:hypothetical protein